MRILSFSILVIAACALSCVTEDHFGSSSEKKILGFTFVGQVGNSQIDQLSREIKLMVGANQNIASLTPDDVVLSTFATIAPDITTAQDYSAPVAYTVTAEDGSTAAYTVLVTQEGTMPQLENTGFDDWYTTPKGYQEPGKDNNSIWASGNAGTTTLGDPNVNPLLINGSDFAAILVTQDMGSLAGLVGQRMAAGSMFTGKFELDLANPLNSAKFGIGFSARPIGLSVKYAYSPGTPYLNKNGTVLAQQDSCDIYALLENRSGAEPKRVATAWFRSGDTAIDSFQTLSLDFIYGPLGNDIPAYQKPANGLYADAGEPVTHITIVFSSSFNGLFLEGGTNSTLVVNDLLLRY
jgi:hypothetical protein